MHRKFGEVWICCFRDICYTFHWRYLANTIELSVHVGDAALC